MDEAVSMLMLLMIHNGIAYAELPKEMPDLNEMEKYRISIERLEDKFIYRLRRNGCPICEYPDTIYVPHSQEICVCCGNQFGYTDCNTSHTELRKQWIHEGMKWWSEYTLAPANWNPVVQLGDEECI